MASSCFIILLCLSIQLISASSTILLLPLTHTLSLTNTTTNTRHLLKSSSIRTIARFNFLKQTHHDHQHHHHQRQISLPLAAGSDYTFPVSLGNPPQTIHLYMDTGSDLVWLPCAPFECILCDLATGDATTTSRPFSDDGTAAVPCSTAACSAAHSNLPSSDLCAISGCPLETLETSSCSSFPCPPFYYAYGDGSLIANLRTDNLFLSTSTTTSMHLRNFTFGCAHTSLAEPLGVAGFGRGILSVPAQLAALSPHLGRRFSYCLAAHSFNSDLLRSPSPLILGRQNEPGFLYTPLLDNPKHPYFYCVGLVAVTVGGKRVPAPPRLRIVDREGNGGMVVDSGTTFTTLPTSMQQRIAAEFDKEVGGRYERAAEVEEETGLRPCYYVSEGARVPRLALNFEGNASVVLPKRNYFLTFLAGGERRSVGCLLVMGGGEEEEGPAGTLGNVQQQGFEVVYDLERRRVGFERKRCSSLWDSLSNR